MAYVARRGVFQPLPGRKHQGKHGSSGRRHMFCFTSIMEGVASHMVSRKSVYQLLIRIILNYFHMAEAIPLLTLVLAYSYCSISPPPAATGVAW